MSEDIRLIYCPGDHWNKHKCMGSSSEGTLNTNQSPRKIMHWRAVTWPRRKRHLKLEGTGFLFRDYKQNFAAAPRMRGSLWKKKEKKNTHVHSLRGISAYNICLISLTWYTSWLRYKNISSDYWNGMDKLTVSGNLSPNYCIRFCWTRV